MIVYSKGEHKEKIAEIIQLLSMDLEPTIAWQINEGNSRIIHEVKLTEIKNDEESLIFSGVNMAFNDREIFFYSKEQKVIFKTQITVKEDNRITVKIPEVMKALDESDQSKMEGMLAAFSHASKDQEESEPSIDDRGNINDSFGFGEKHDGHQWLTDSMSEHDAKILSEELSYITLEEEDQMFEGMRATPRAKPPEGKMITVQVEKDARPQASYMLYDLSQGGLSFLVFTKDEFSVGEKVFIKAFDTKKFETPIISEVKAIRDADQLGVQFKVGCEFINQA